MPNRCNHSKARLNRFSVTYDTLAKKLGTSVHFSPLLRKARRLGLSTPKDLWTLAVQRGCRHYWHGDEPEGELVPQTALTNEELAVALLNAAGPYSPHSIRCRAAILGAIGNDPTMVRKFEAKPIRAFRTTATQDMENCEGDCFLTDREMDKALNFSGYDNRFRTIEGRHVAGYTENYREAMAYLWKDWPQRVKAVPSAPRAQEVILADEGWQPLAEGFKKCPRPVLQRKGRGLFRRHHRRQNPPHQSGWHRVRICCEHRQQDLETHPVARHGPVEPVDAGNRHETVNRCAPPAIPPT